jgi:DTW domain-containing protein YfiP
VSTLDRTAPRPRCPRCRKAATMCYCALVPRLETATRVVILQHTRERDVAIGTARMASLALPQAELHVGVRWDERPAVVQALTDPARPAILLYPGPGAIDILTAPPTGPVTLVVVDGTWSQARRVVRDNPILQALPRYGFAAPEPSRYRIRREPDAAYCSTIEALMHVLGALEGDPPRFRALLTPFEAMIDAQLACEASAPPQRDRSMRPRRPAPPQLPASLATRWDDLLCVVGEANAWHAAPGVAAPPPELIHWVAYRPSDGATFDQIVRPTGPLAPPTLGHCELTAAALAAGCDHATLLARFAAFVRPTDVMCAWGPRSPALFAGHGGALPATQLDLRAIAQRYARRKIGTLEAYAGPTAAPLAEGRAGRRLAMLAALVHGWRARLRGDAPAGDDVSAPSA